MKRLFTTAMVMGLAAMTGCNSGTPGGAGTTNPESKSSFGGHADNTFTLGVPSSLPLMGTSLKQGDTAKIVISIKRGKSFQDDVALKFEGLPNGVTIDQAGAQIKHDQTETNVTLTAADNAALGEFEIKVLGHPTKGGDATNTFKITIDKKETFTVSVPTFSTKIKQGETKAVSISISRDKKFDQDVTLSFTNLPKGTTIEPASPVIKHGETEAKLSIKSDKDAALGDFVVAVTGHPTKGADAMHDFKITVDKK